MGRCISVITLSGAASLGLLTGSMTYQALQGIPDLIRQLNQQSDAAPSSSAVVSAIKANLTVSNLVHVALAALSSSFFTTAYKYSPATGKHPYLIYSALAAPLSLVALLAAAGKQQFQLGQWMSSWYTKKCSGKSKAAEAPASREASVEADSMGSSYINVSDDSSETSESPVDVGAEEVQPVASAIEQEVENALLKKERMHGLEAVRAAYQISAAIASVGFAVCSIGFIGDRYFL